MIHLYDGSSSSLKQKIKLPLGKGTLFTHLKINSLVWIMIGVLERWVLNKVQYVLLNAI